ncbi:La- protein 4 [Mortierella sp. AD094]|nr:La- protein 4 [Mortierella sp. AD094]
MNGNPVMAQMPSMNAYAMDMGEIPQLQPRQTQQRLYYKNKGNRSNGNNSQRAAPPRNSNNHNHSNNNYGNNNGSRNTYGNGAHNKANGAYRNQSNSGGMGAYKGNRTHNQQQHQLNPQYRHHDNSAQNRGHNYAHISGRMDLLHQSPNHRKYSNDSGIMIPDSHYRQQGSYPLPIEAHPQDPNLAMSRSSSYESVQQQEYHMQGFHPTHSPGPHSDVVDDRYTRDLSVHRQSMQSSHSDAQHSEGTYSPEGPWSALDIGTPVPSDTVYQFQPTYIVPWVYPQQIVHDFPPMMPLNHHPSQAMSDSQEDSEAGKQTPSRNITPDVGASCNEDHDGRDRLREQLEWYFSPRNLATDTYLVSKMNADRWVSISVIAEFRKVKEITDDLQEVVSALRRSSVVLVDETGSMVKAITVDRPRTTLILRELPEDTTSEEIAGVFAEACPAKSVKKESVGNMWFVEFETAEDALAMLMHTRGKYLRGTPIAARLKSNTVLTGGEYRETQKTPSVAGNPAIPGPAYGWSSSPPNPSDGPYAPGFPMPYRRFPVEDGTEARELWSSPQVPSQSPQEMAHHHFMEHPYPPDVFLPPNAYGMNGQMWIPAPAFAMPLQEAQLDQINAGHGFTRPGQMSFSYVGELGRNDNCIQSGRDNGEGFVGRKGGYNNRKSHIGGSGEGQYRRYGRQEPAEYGRQEFQHYGQRDGQEYRQRNFCDNYNYYSPRGYGRYPGKEIPGVIQSIRFNLHSDSRSDLSSTSGPHSYNNTKKKKNKLKNKRAKSQQNAEHLPSDICENNGDRNTNDHTTTQASEEPNCEQAENPCKEITGGLTNLVIEDSISAVETTNVVPEELQITTVNYSHDNLEQEKESGLESKTPKLPVARGYWKLGRNKRRNSGRQLVKIVQKTPSLESDDFPPLPSTNASDLQGSLPTDLSKSLGRPSHSWAPHSAKSQTNDGEFSVQSQEHSASPRVIDQDSSIASDSNQNQSQSSMAEGSHTGGNSSSSSTSSTSSKTAQPLQRYMPMAGMVMGAIEYNSGGVVEEVRYEKKSHGYKVAKPAGGFSYASALKVQQQQYQREGPVESAAPVVMSNNRV